jgi:hypothetical protein
MNINIKAKIQKSNIFIQDMENNFFDNLILLNISMTKPIPKSEFLKYFNFEKLNLILDKYDNNFSKFNKLNQFINNYSPSKLFLKSNNLKFIIFNTDIFKLYDSYLNDNHFLIITNKFEHIYSFYNFNKKNFDIIFTKKPDDYTKNINKLNIYNSYKNNIEELKNKKYDTIFLSFSYIPYFIKSFLHENYISQILENINLIFEKLNINGNLIIPLRFDYFHIYKNLIKLFNLFFDNYDIIYNDFFNVNISCYLILKKFNNKNINIKLQKNINTDFLYQNIFTQPNITLYNNITGVSKSKPVFIKELEDNANKFTDYINFIKNSFIKNNEILFDEYENYFINSYKNIIKEIINQFKIKNIIIPSNFNKLITNYDKYKLNKIFSLTDVYSQKVIALSNINKNNLLNIDDYNYMTNYYDLQESQLKNRKYIEQENRELFKNVKSIIEDFARGVSHYINDYYPLEFKVSNAFLKSWEIYSNINLSFKNINSNIITSFHFAELPGNFIKSLEYFISNKFPNKSLDWMAESLNPKNPINIKIFGNKIFNDHIFVKKFQNKWIWGPKNNDTGNIMDLNIIKYFRNINLQRKPNLLTSDAGLDEEKMDLFTLQKLEFAQAFAVISSSVQGSDVIVKHFLPFMVGKEDTRFSGPYFTSLLFFYRKFFKELYFFKPMTGSPTSSEFYVIGINSKSMNDNEFELYGQKLNNFAINTYIEDINNIPKLFINQIYTLFDEIIRKINYEAVENFNYLYLFYDEFIEENPNLEKIKNEKYKEWINKYSFTN